MKTNKLTSIKCLSIGIGLALSFGNVINASPSFAGECYLVNGKQLCRAGDRRHFPPTATVSSQQQFKYCNGTNTTANCNKDFPKKDDFRTLPPDILAPHGGLTAPPKVFPQQ
jgi:hypothetical protein